MFCAQPFREFQVRTDGVVHCCCEGWLPRPIGNIFESSAAEIWSGEPVQEIRASVLDGSFRYCTRCPYLPGPGGFVKEHAPAELDPSRIGTLLLNYDRTCNLACPSCRQQHVVLSREDPQVRRVHEAVLGSGALDVADRVYVTGSGDPLASPTFWHFLTHLPDLSANPGLRLALHTNGQLLDEQHWEMLDRPRLSEINISIDAATPETYAKNRGGSWYRLWRNIEHACQRRREEGLAFELGTHFVAQANNFRELTPFVELSLSRGADWVNVLFLRNWGTYDEDDYRRRSVHLPGHPEHPEFSDVMTSLRANPLVVLPTFPARDLIPITPAR